MLGGTERCKLDERGRMPIPARFKDAFDTGAVLSRRAGAPCVVVHTLASFELARQDIERLDEDELGMEARRDFWEFAFEQKKDGQNRITIEQPLREWASLGKDLVVLGSGDYLEVWNAQEWEDRRAARVAARDQLIPKLAALKSAARGQGA